MLYAYSVSSEIRVFGIVEHTTVEPNLTVILMMQCCCGMLERSIILFYLVFLSMGMSLYHV